MTYSKNEIKEYDEENSRYPYKMKYGFRVDQGMRSDSRRAVQGL